MREDQAVFPHCIFLRVLTRGFCSPRTHAQDVGLKLKQFEGNLQYPQKHLASSGDLKILKTFLDICCTPWLNIARFSKCLKKIDF
jgi:hypothetical protein